MGNLSLPRRRRIGAVAAAALIGTVLVPGGVAHADDAVTITPAPSYRQPTFEGWGTSLVWFANATGDYPDEIRNALADMVFGEDGLNLNIARYNIGGGNAPDVHYASGGAAAPVVEVPVSLAGGDSVRTSAVRVVMEATSYMTVSEIQVMAKAPAPAE